jgi:hypothetical protein
MESCCLLVLVLDNIKWYLVGGDWNHVFFMTFPSYWEFHHPNWRTPSFFRGVGIPPTRSQMWGFSLWTVWIGSRRWYIECLEKINMELSHCQVALPQITVFTILCVLLLLL